MMIGARTCSVICLLFSMVILAFSASRESPTVEELKSVRLAGSVWKGKVWGSGDGKARDFTLFFMPDGRLYYISPTGFFKNGKWQQNGSSVSFHMNDHYADYEGHLVGENLRGTAKNVKKKRWRWSVRLDRAGKLPEP